MNGEEFREALKLFMPENTFHRATDVLGVLPNADTAKAWFISYCPRFWAAIDTERQERWRQWKLLWLVLWTETLIRKQQCERLSAKRHQVGMHTRSHNLNCKNSRIHVSRLNIYNITILHVKANYFWILVMLIFVYTLRHNEQGAGWCASVTW